MATTEQELRLRHLTDIQATITRLAQNSFTIRGWSVTLVSIVFAILNTNATAGVAWLPLLPALVFWWLDAYYLRLERLYRRLYTATALQLTNGTVTNPDVEPFDMDVSRYQSTVPTLWRTLVAPSVITIPAVLTAVITGYFFAAL